MTKDITDEEDGNGDVKVVSLHAEIRLDTLDSRSGKGVPVEIVQDDQGEERRHQTPIDLN